MISEKKIFSRYEYKTGYVKNIDKFKHDIMLKKIIPYQVEIQPGPISDKICWLECPFCYGKSANDTGQRLTKERYIELIKEIAEGGVKKVIFAGWATDPLFYKYIDELVETALDSDLIIGFNTRVINISDRLIGLITSSSVQKDSYLSVSVDSGDNTSYDQVHAVSRPSRLYDRVCENVRRIKINLNKNGGSLFTSITYLINQDNCDEKLILKFIEDYKLAGVDLIRFSFPQIPRGDQEGENASILTHPERMALQESLKPIIQRSNSGGSKVLFVEADDLFYKKRTTPCFARFIYPTIGFDGWLYHCSQSAGPNFHSIALGDLRQNGFWKLFYNYNMDNIERYINELSTCLNKSDCRCDRKEHTVNRKLFKSGVFQDT
tara:strand:+ start:534 stop:1667 length:1134 start_codon:yes stop_codon:yes gene_type:complete